MKFKGEHEKFWQVPVGWVSFDRALRASPTKVGITSRSFIEIYGETGVGKTTIAVSLASALAKHESIKRDIACLDLESMNPQLVENVCNSTRFNGTWKWTKSDIKPKKDQSVATMHVKKLENLNRKYFTNGDITIMDSVAAVIPVAEAEGDIGDANIGKRAFALAQYSREINTLLGEDGLFTFLTNHKYPEVATGLMFKTYGTPGGKVKNFFLTVLLDVKVPWLKIGESKKEMRFGDGWLIEGKVAKNRHGVKGETFWLFIIGGYGVHSGLTAMFDCLKFKLAKWAGGKGITTAEIALKSTGETLGKVGDVVNDRDSLDFSIFHNALTEMQQELEPLVEEFVDVSGEDDEE